ncbi:hypothetical protein ZIOFF_009771 [Zingiber officinale]|uniref:Symplekin n=1 Tax=Zingiber officinale TaxID=94328 RepID=A0A8J5LNY0_ZINOF|nr:hypothetical protein ZIOFF_009771 [Zingiber officinale]
MATEDGGGMAEGFEASVEGRDALPEIGVAVARDSLRAIESWKESPGALAISRPCLNEVLIHRFAASYTLLVDRVTDFVKAILPMNVLPLQQEWYCNHLNVLWLSFSTNKLVEFDRLLKDLGSKVSEELTVLMPNLLTTLRHPDLFVVKQSISSGTALFGAVLEEIALQLHGSGKIEHWLEELWSWMVRFKDSVSAILMEPGSIGIKMPALKFIEACILYFTPCEDNGVSSTEGNLSDSAFIYIPFPTFLGKFMRFNVSHLSSNNSILNPAVLETEADRALDFLLDVLLSANTFCGSFVIAVINILATIVKRRPLRYKVILSALISLNPNFESQKGGHASSIRYSLRTAFVGFLRCNHPFFTESKEKIIRALHAIIPGESVDQIVRQVERMSRTMDRVSHEIRSNKGESPAVQDFQIGDQIRSKISRLPSDAPFEELPSKRIRFEVPSNMAHSTQMTSALPDDNDDGNGDYSSSTSLVDGDSSAAAKMISMIGALLAEGKRGAESLELLVSNIHADLMADIVIETMKHLPKNLMVVSVWHNNAPLNEEIPSSSFSSQVVPTTTSVSVPIPSLSPELASNAVGANGVGTPDTSPVSNLAAEVRRDPRRDPRRLDPRRPGPVGSLHSAPLNSESSSDVQPGPSQDSSKAVPTAEAIIAEQSSMPLASKTEVEPSEIPDTKGMGKMQSLETSEDQDMALEQTSDVHTPASSTSEQAVEEQLAASTPSDVTANDDVNLPESDEFVSADINSLGPEENFHNLIAHPPLFELIDEQKTNLHRLAVTRIIEDYKKIHVTGSSQACLPLLARLIAHTGVDEDILKFLEEHIVLDYPHHKGHELAMHVLYYLQAIVISKADNCSSAASSYEKFLLGIAKALLDSLPATDKSFSKLLVEAPILPDSSLKLLEGLCHSNCNEHRLEETLDGDRVTQGLVATWSLILGRPSYREACLDIALKCAVHPQEEVRAKAIRLVANKLYLLNYASDSIEQFAMRMLLFVVEQQNFEEDINAQNSSDQQTETRVFSLLNPDKNDTLVGGPRPSEPASSESENNKDNQASEMKVPALSLSQAQQKTSLFFALCSKKPSLLQFVFDIYGRAPKAVKQLLMMTKNCYMQSIHQHIPFIVKNLSTYSELLKLISDPSEGSKNLIVLVLETLTEEATPSSELIAAVKHLYETKLKDAVILIPMLSSFSKDEVLPIFPRLVDLPLEKFQAALARILQFPLSASRIVRRSWPLRSHVVLRLLLLNLNFVVDSGFAKELGLELLRLAGSILLHLELQLEVLDGDGFGGLDVDHLGQTQPLRLLHGELCIGGRNLRLSLGLEQPNFGQDLDLRINLGSILPCPIVALLGAYLALHSCFHDVDLGLIGCLLLHLLAEPVSAKTTSILVGPTTTVLALASSDIYWFTHADTIQGSAHTGPALTPAEVLIAIHNINPQRDGVALKKASEAISLFIYYSRMLLLLRLNLFFDWILFCLQITDACTACFEQRIVFTQHVIAKSLNHLVEQVPLPLLFMRTVIQAIDAFPPLVDFVMSILSKLVTQQIWKMPKLWVGFLKCAAQTQPRSFNVLLQLPSPHLESALNRHPQLRTPLSAYANQPNLRTSLPRYLHFLRTYDDSSREFVLRYHCDIDFHRKFSLTEYYRLNHSILSVNDANGGQGARKGSWQTLKLLGLLDETQDDTRSSVPTTLQAPETKSSIHGTALT